MTKGSAGDNPVASGDETSGVDKGDGHDGFTPSLALACGCGLGHSLTLPLDWRCRQSIEAARREQRRSSLAKPSWKKAAPCKIKKSAWLASTLAQPQSVRTWLIDQLRRLDPDFNDSTGEQKPLQDRLKEEKHLLAVAQLLLRMYGCHR
ncbi:hypothetical protein ANO14919_079350 [Xylariales sp. No.14919]|nr:hypothetical protein ANO14919_079350 [Xylariales sp. No.14919]